MFGCLLSLIGLVALALLLPILGLLIFLEDRHSIFYKQQRIGLHGRLFTTYKLRTMAANADDYLSWHPEVQARWKEKGKLSDDPRITRIGRFLRRTSLDELPQLLNILRGEMTLVGPRAIQASEVAAFGELSQLRQEVKPGLTGLLADQRSFIYHISTTLCTRLHLYSRMLVTGGYTHSYQNHSCCFVWLGSLLV